MERFPEPTNIEAGGDVRAAIAQRYAEVRIKLCDLADELGKHNAEEVHSVLDKYLPEISQKVDWLESRVDITSNFSGQMWEAEEEEKKERQRQTIRVNEAEWKRLQDETKQQQVQISSDQTVILGLQREVREL